MDSVISRLNDELLGQDQPEQAYIDELDRYKGIASGYADVESAVAVLSDMHTDSSYIYYGGFSQTLGISPTGTNGRIDSIWEEEILGLVHPDDLYSKYLQELRFFHFMKRLPRGKCTDYYHAGKLRMKKAGGGYAPVLHRIFYIFSPSGGNLCLTLCLYTPLLFEMSANGIVVNAVTGETMELERRNDAKILSEREKQVLRLIDKGMISKHIANELYISVNTVSRHRQKILGKLRVKNSIEACRVAKDLGII